MKILSNNNEINIKICNNYFNKLLGLMFKKKINYGILLKNCNSVHTFFCYINLDIIMLDKDFNIIKIYKNVSKNKIIYPIKGVKHILEIPSGTINLNKIKIDFE